MIQKIQTEKEQILNKVIYQIIYFLSFNLILLITAGVFAYRTFVLDRFNWALLILVIALFLINICRAIARYNEAATITLIYRIFVLLSVALLITALCVQTIRFIYVFVPTMTDFTLPKILVRVGITTTIFYIYALIISFIYYLYANEMLSAVWYGSLDRFLKHSILRDKARQKWRQGRFASIAFIYTFFLGGFASVLTLGIGLIAWLLR
jgi:hypothetical protein